MSFVIAYIFIIIAIAMHDMIIIKHTHTQTDLFNWNIKNTE